MYNGITPYGFQFDGNGNRIYKCIHCLDAGFVHPRRENGTPDYSRTKPCPHCLGGKTAGKT
jgi:hypothetical protein